MNTVQSGGGRGFNQNKKMGGIDLWEVSKDSNCLTFICLSHIMNNSKVEICKFSNQEGEGREEGKRVIQDVSLFDFLG